MPRQVDWDERRAELAEAVWRTIARRGLEGTSIRNIAEESSWTRGVLQLYFRNKDDLMLYAFELACDRALEVDRRAWHGATGLGILRCLLAAYLEPDDEQRRVALVLNAFITHAKRQPELAAALRRRYTEWMATAQELFRRLAAEGALRPGLVPERAAVEYFAFATGLAELDLIDDDLLRRESGRQVVDDYLRRIGSPAELERLGLEPQH
jgi:AcrR family transcriptional regulator